MKIVMFFLALVGMHVSASLQAETRVFTLSMDETSEPVSFTLRNSTLSSIPLLIPGVMNPNLSPKSDSGVSLKVGQKILFKYNGKRRVLLIVSEDLEGQVLNVAKLLKERKRELREKD